ncbi:MAG: sulfur carrier protein ThiS [Proteobacteria bacterium]|nr:sulfur carrier protein ThiS [Pseudomonadota bacterium]
MRVKVNGKEYELPENLTVLQMLNFFKINHNFVAVERNKEIVSRKDWENVKVCDGDVFEIVTFVGGG